MKHFFPSWATPVLLLLQGDLVTPEDSEPEETIQFQLINFNFDTVRVTWNTSGFPGTNLSFLYTFGSVAIRPCPTYILEQGCTAGCVLEVEANEDGDRDLVLEISLSNGTDMFVNTSVWISSYLKPGSLKDLKFLWKQEEVTITCPELPYEGLLYEVQYKSKFDSGWQSTEEEDRCRVTIESLDADKCYYFRARVKTVVSSYGSGTYPSNWSEVMHWQGGEQRDACGQEKVPFPKSVLISCLMALLTLCFLLSLCKLQRVKKALMPNVPDPKFTFPGLFEDHRGNFQEWIKDTQNVTHVNKVENELEDCAPEEMLFAQLIKAENETPMTGPLCPQKDVEKATGPGQHCGPPQSGDVVALGGFSFVVNDNAYVML